MGRVLFFLLKGSLQFLSVKTVTSVFRIMFMGLKQCFDDIDVFLVYRKQKGKLPTGMLLRTAKATGFSSVYEMLIRKETACLNSTSVLKDVNSSPKKQVASKVGWSSSFLTPSLSVGL